MRSPWPLALLSAGCVADRPEVATPPMTVRVTTADPEGRPTDGRGLAMRVWGPGDPTPLAAPEARPEPAPSESQPEPKAEPTQSGPGKPDQPAAGPGAAATDPATAPAKPEVAPQDRTPPDEGTRRQRDAELRNQFGSSIIISPDGLVTKQYFLSGEAATVFESLLREPGVATPPESVSSGFDLDKKSQSVLARMLGEHSVRLTLFKEFEKIVAADIKGDVRGANPPPGPPISNSLLLVAAQPPALAAFEAALNLFFSSVPQIELEVKVVEFQISDAVAFGITPVDNTTPTFSNLGSDRLIRDLSTFFPLSPPVIGAGGGTDRGVLTLGGVHDRWELNARLEALEINQLADILSQPKLTVRNGGTASVSTVTQVPFTKAKFTSSGSNVVSDIDFKPVGISVNIRPVIAGTDTVILQIYAKVSAVTGFTPTEPVPTPTISEREVVTQVHVRHDQATTISGLLSKSVFDNVSKVPLLGDIPIIGYLFRSSSKQETTQNVEFIIIPRIKYGLDRTEDASFLNPLGG